MMLADVQDAQAFKDAEEICVDMGTYFQVQDDYLDCYATPEVLGKIGTDIKDAKCCWLIIQVLLPFAVFTNIAADVIVVHSPSPLLSTTLL